MKRFVCIVLVICVILILVACDAGEVPTEIVENKQVEETIQPTPSAVVEENHEEQEPEKSSEPEDSILPDESENWRIAIVSTNFHDGDEVRTAEMLKERFGEDRIIHIRWHLWADNNPSHVTVERIVEGLAEAQDIRAVVMGRSVISTNRGIEAFRNMREDVFIFNAAMLQNAQETSELADIVLGGDLLSTASAAVRTAYEMGASTFVNYLSDLQLELEHPASLARRDAMREEAQRLGMEFVDVTVYRIKFVEDLGPAEAMNKAREFVFEDVQRMVAQHGRDTAFFTSFCLMQPSLILSVIEAGAIYAMPCCPTPFDGIPFALALFGCLGSALREFTDVEVVEIIREHLEAMGMLGRMASFPRSLDMMNVVVGVEYAVKWINEEVPREGIDMDVLHEIIERELGLPVRLTLYEEDGVVLDNFVLINVDELMIF